MELNENEYQRFARQIVLPEFGLSSQLKLKQSKVLVVGAGGLGNPVLMYLAAAGIGTLGLTEMDKIQLSNLQRQILFSNEEVDKQKQDVAEDKIKRMNPSLVFKKFAEKLNSANALTIIEQFDLVVDCSDNFPTRYLVNDACEILQIPFVFGAIHQYEAQMAVYNLSGSATYRDHFPSPPHVEDAPDCATAGVLGPIAGILGSWQALEAIKVICMPEKVNAGELMVFNFLQNQIKKIKIPKDPSRVQIRKLIDYELFCANQNKNDLKLDKKEFLILKEMDPNHCLVDVREPYEYEEDYCGGINIPLGDILANPSIIDKLEKPIVFFCSSAKRSKKAVEYLVQIKPSIPFYYLSFKPE